MRKKFFYAWFVWSIAGSYVLYQFSLQASTSVMIPSLTQAFNVSITDIGFLSASFFYTYIVLQIPAGLIVDRIGARRLLSFSVLLCVGAVLMFASAHTLNMAELSRLLMGVATAPAVVIAMYLASNWLPPEKFALAAGLTEMLGLAGGAIGEELLAHCILGLGWRATMYAGAIAGILLLVLAWLIVRDYPGRTVPQRLAKQQDFSVWQALLRIVRMPQSWINGLYAGLMFALLQAFASFWAVPFLVQCYHFDLNWAAGLSSMVFIGAALGTPVAGWLSDKMGRRKPVMIAGSFLALIVMATAVYTYPIPLPVMFILLFSLGLFCSAYVIPFAVMKEIMPVQIRGTAMGYTNMMAILIGAPLLQPLIGWLLKEHAVGHMQGIKQFSLIDYRSAFIVLIICITTALILSFFVRETFCRTQA